MFSTVFVKGRHLKKYAFLDHVSRLRRKQPSEYPLLLITQCLVLFSPVYFFSYCSRIMNNNVFVIFGNARFSEKMLHQFRWFTRIRRFADKVFFLHTRKEMGEYVLIKSYIYMLTKKQCHCLEKKNTCFYVKVYVHKFLTNFKTCILLLKNALIFGNVF